MCPSHRLCDFSSIHLSLCVHVCMHLCDMADWHGDILTSRSECEEWLTVQKCCLKEPRGPSLHHEKANRGAAELPVFNLLMTMLSQENTVNSTFKAQHLQITLPAQSSKDSVTQPLQYSQRLTGSHNHCSTVKQLQGHTITTAHKKNYITYGHPERAFQWFYL